MFKIAVFLILSFGVDVVLGNVAGELLHTFGVDTGFWTQYGLVMLPQSVIALGVLAGSSTD